MNERKASSDDRHIVVVGPCAAGKTTLVEHLQERGFAARVVAQEHSIIGDLFRKRYPDVVIALDLDLETLRQRRSPTWSVNIYADQHERLKEAFAAADLFIDTVEHDEQEVADMVVEWLEATRDR